jgi:hypothetical protein
MGAARAKTGQLDRPPLISQWYDVLLTRNQVELVSIRPVHENGVFIK